MSARRSQEPVSPSWRSRIVGSGDEDPTQLLANPRNWRIHPRLQQQALGEVLDTVGWVQQVLVNRVTGHVVDGHLRVELALSKQEPTVPVLYVELTLEEEALVLASLDPLGALAGRDSEKFRELMSDVTMDFASLEETLRTLSADYLDWDDRRAEWEGMPEYVSDDQTGFHDIRIRFATAEDMAAFATLVGQSITDRTRTIWYPQAEVLEVIDKRYATADA